MKYNGPERRVKTRRVQQRRNDEAHVSTRRTVERRKDK